jgi:hypothetical protein
LEASVLLEEIVCLFPGAIEQFAAPFAHDRKDKVVVVVGLLDDPLDGGSSVEDFASDRQAFRCG